VPFGGMVSVSSASFNRPLAPSGIFVLSRSWQLN
jgi:hypothetical protein